MKVVNSGLMTVILWGGVYMDTLLHSPCEIEWFYSCYINAHCCGEFCIT